MLMFTRSALLLALLLSNLGLWLLPDGFPLRVAAGLLLALCLPGLAWANLLFGYEPWPIRAVISLSISLLVTSLGTLFLHYLFGSVTVLWLAVLFNIVTLPALLLRALQHKIPTVTRSPEASPSIEKQLHLPLLLLIATAAAILRFTSLGYSEFQGDEALTMITAAEVLEGHSDTLFLRGKGPGEALLPAALWRLSGTITEATARLPFAVVSLAAIAALYLLARELAGRNTALLAALFTSFNGLTIGFGRIVQYQSLVLFTAAAAILLTLKWREERRLRYLLLASFVTGLGLLNHYDGLAVIPVLGWLLLARSPRFGAPERQTVLHRAQATGFAALLLLGALAVAASFYVPYLLDAQATRTGTYLVDRIGKTLLSNNLHEFAHFTSFYSSFYYLAATGALVAAFVLRSVQRIRWGRYWLPGLSLAALAVATRFPSLISAGGVDLTALVYILVFAIAWLAPHSNLYQRLTITWLAVTFVGYNFLVAYPLTHIYTIAPAWALAAGKALDELLQHIQRKAVGMPFLPATAALGLGLLFFPFCYNAYLRQDVSYLYDHPRGNLPLYWTPFEAPPATGFFGFVHRAGWKNVGQLYQEGTLVGDYASNEKQEITTWHLRHAHTGCSRSPEFVFLAEDIVDRREIPSDVESRYAPIGEVLLANGKRMTLLQLAPASLTLGTLHDDGTLSQAFNRSAYPAAFVRQPVDIPTPLDANFENQIGLRGYALDARRAYPGGRLALTLYWYALSPVANDYHVFVHLGAEPIAAQADGVPVCWSYPTSLWRPGQLISDHHELLLADDLAPGEYPLRVGWYAQDSFERLNVLTGEGMPLANYIQLAVVEVKAQP